MNKRATGTAGEKIAEKYLKEHGVRIIETNFRSKRGEIDLIGYHQEYLVFIEVKYRSDTGKGYALDAVDHRKQCRICKAADYYRYIHRIGDNVPIRYDVVGIQENTVQWIKNAFWHIYT